MFTGKISLYKTPLDSNYLNVIDFNINDISNDINEINDYNIREYLKQKIFDVYYEPKEISLSNFKGVKNDLINLSITIPYQYAEIRYYNYCIISSGLLLNDIRFYFISNIVSENDSLTNPSCTLHLTLDVWNNNIYEIISNKYYGRVKCRHYDRVSKIENDKLIYNMYNVINEKFDYQIEKKVLGENTSDRFKLLYCIYELKDSEIPNLGDPEFKVSLRIGQTIKNDVKITKYANYLQTYYMKNLIYIPIGLYDTLIDEFVEFDLISKPYDLDKQDIGINGISKQFSKLVTIPVIEKLLPYTARIHLSYETPFKYTVEYQISSYDMVVNLDFTGAAFKSIDDNLFITPLIPLEVEYDNTTLEFDISEFVSLTSNALDTIVFHGGKYGSIDTYDLLDIPNNKSDIDEYGIEPQKYNYPFKFLSLSINNYQYPLVSNTLDNTNFRYIYDFRTFQPRFFILEKGKSIFSPQGFYLNGSGTLSFSIDALDDYLIRNGSQEKTAQAISRMSSNIGAGATLFSGLTSIAGGLLLGNPMSIVSGISSFSSIPNQLMQPQYKQMSINAIHNDLANTPDTVNVNSGENDKTYQNRVQLYMYSVNESNTNYKNSMNNFHMYGYNIENYEDISNINNRINFDYICCDYVDLPLKISNIEKNILSNIFMRGTFKNHYNYNNGEIIFNSTFNKSIGNRERKFVFDETYKNWLNS